jgi:hypothetical protein
MLHILTSAMAIQLPRDLDARVQAAVRHFWDTRSTQASKQQQGGRADQGARSAVTGGAQMDGFIDLLAGLAIEFGARREDVRRGKHGRLPGLFLASRQWNLAVFHNDQVLCAFKVVSSDRTGDREPTEALVNDAIGSACELWGAYRESTINKDIQPWLGCVLAAEAPKRGALSSIRHGGHAQFCSRLVRERLYSGAALLLARDDGRYLDPAVGLTLRHLCRTLAALVSVYANA